MHAHEMTAGAAAIVARRAEREARAEAGGKFQHPTKSSNYMYDPNFERNSGPKSVPKFLKKNREIRMPSCLGQPGGVVAVA